MKRLGWFLAAPFAALTACAETATAPQPLAHCALSVTSEITLAAAGDTAIDPVTDSGCVSFPVNGSATASAEYLVVAQSAGGVPGDSAAFTLRSATLVEHAPRRSRRRRSAASAPSQCAPTATVASTSQ